MWKSLYDTFRARYSGFSKSTYSDPSQIKIQEKNVIHRIYQFAISFLGLHSLKISNIICNAQFHSFDPFYLDCLFKFGLRKIVEKCVDFVDCLVVWWIDNHRDASWGSETTKNCAGWDLASTVNEMLFKIGAFEVFLHQSCIIGMFIILVQDTTIF